MSDFSLVRGVTEEQTAFPAGNRRQTCLVRRRQYGEYNKAILGASLGTQTDTGRSYNNPHHKTLRAELTRLFIRTNVALEPG